MKGWMYSFLELAISVLWIVLSTRLLSKQKKRRIVVQKGEMPSANFSPRVRQEAIQSRCVCKIFSVAASDPKVIDDEFVGRHPKPSYRPPIVETTNRKRDISRKKYLTAKACHFAAHEFVVFEIMDCARESLDSMQRKISKLFNGANPDSQIYIFLFASYLHQHASWLSHQHVATIPRRRRSTPYRAGTLRHRVKVPYACRPSQYRATFSAPSVGVGTGAVKTRDGSFDFLEVNRNLFSANGGAPWPEVPHFFREPALNNDRVEVSYEIFEPIVNILTTQLQCRSGDDPTTHGSVDCPSPAVPSSANTKCNDYQSGWNVGFVDGCVFTTRASGGPPSCGPPTQRDPVGCTARIPPVSLPSNHQAMEYREGWYAGFTAGCAFATRTSETSLFDAPRPRSDLTERARYISPSAASTAIGSPDPISNNISSHQSSTDASNATTLSQFEVSQDLEAEIVIDRSHRNLELSPIQMTFNSNSNRGNRVQGNAVPLQEPDSSNTNTLIRLNTGRMHRHEENKKHKCDVCGKAFRKKYQLGDHMHQHRGQSKSHPCDFPGCNKSFTNRANMRRHHKIHSNTPTMPENNE